MRSSRDEVPSEQSSQGSKRQKVCFVEFWQTSHTLSIVIQFHFFLQAVSASNPVVEKQPRSYLEPLPFDFVLNAISQHYPHLGTQNEGVSTSSSFSPQALSQPAEPLQQAQAFSSDNKPRKPRSHASDSQEVFVPDTAKPTKIAAVPAQQAAVQSVVVPVKQGFYVPPAAQKNYANSKQSIQPGVPLSTQLPKVQPKNVVPPAQLKSKNIPLVMQPQPPVQPQPKNIPPPTLLTPNPTLLQKYPVLYGHPGQVMAGSAAAASVQLLAANQMALQNAYLAQLVRLPAAIFIFT